MNVLVIPEDFRNDQYILRPLFQRLHVKEKYFDKLARQRGVADGPGGGQKSLGEEASRNIAAIRQKCREEFDRLAKRIGLTV